jgi:asparagine synthase (glutamine-hydrolysing)
VDEVLAPEALREAGIFEAPAVQKLFDKCRRARDRTPSNVDNMALTGVLGTQLVHRLLVKGPGLLGPAPERLGRFCDCGSASQLGSGEPRG